MKTYQELSLKEKIVQVRLMKRSGWNKPDIARTLDLSPRTIRLILEDFAMMPSDRVEEELRYRNHV